MVDTELRNQVNSQGYAIGDIETFGGIPRVTLYKKVEVGKTKDGTPKQYGSLCLVCQVMLIV